MKARAGADAKSVPPSKKRAAGTQKKEEKSNAEEIESRK